MVFSSQFIPNAVRNPYHDSTRNTRMRRMTHGLIVPVLAKKSSAWMLRSAQHDKTDCVIPLTFFCHSERSEESMTLCVMAKVDASLRYASFSMTKLTVSFRTPARNPHTDDTQRTQMKWTWHRLVLFASVALCPLCFYHKAHKVHEDFVQNSVFIATTKAAFLLFQLGRLLPSSFAFLFGAKRVKIFIFRCFLKNERVVFPTKQDYNYEYCHLREQSHH